MVVSGWGSGPKTCPWVLSGQSLAAGALSPEAASALVPIALKPWGPPVSLGVPRVLPAPRSWGQFLLRVVRVATVTIIYGGGAGLEAVPACLWGIKRGPKPISNPACAQPPSSGYTSGTEVPGGCVPAPGACHPARMGTVQPGLYPDRALGASSSGAPGTRPSLLHGYHRHDARLPHPRWPAHPWVQHPAAPSMLSDVQWTALPALLPPAPGESQQGTPTGDAWGQPGLWVPRGCVGSPAHWHASFWGHGVCWRPRGGGRGAAMPTMGV